MGIVTSTDDCFICRHPCQGEIDALIQRVPTEELMDDEVARALTYEVNAIVCTGHNPHYRGLWWLSW